MQGEGERLASFGNYPLDRSGGSSRRYLPYLSPIKLAEAGFFRHEGLTSDEVKCFSCGLKVKNWGSESPLTVHRVLRPDCKHLKEIYQTPTRPGIALPGSAAPDEDSLRRARRQLFGEDTSSSNDIAGRLSILNIADPCSLSAPFVTDDLMLFESHRLMTYMNPLDTISQAWAKEGFLADLSSEGLMIICVFCGRKASIEAGCPAEVHQKISPGCPLVNRVDAGNISRDEEEQIKRMHGDERGNREGLQLYPQFQDLPTRLETFGKWSNILQNILPKETLAEAGFFYSGCGDCVRCFYCGTGLWNWETGADPWNQHARWQPSCPFLLEQRGQDFVFKCMDIQPKCEFTAPKEGPLSIQGDVRSTSPLLPQLPLESVQAALECGYKIELIRQALRFVFLASRGYWPNWPLLVGKLQSYEANSALLQKQSSRMLGMQQEHQQEVHEMQQEKDVALQEKDVLYQQEMQRKEALQQEMQRERQSLQTALERQQLELQRLNRALEQERTQHSQHSQVLSDSNNHKLSLISRQGQELTRRNQVISSNAQTLASNAQTLASKDQALASNAQALAWKDQEVQSKDALIEMLAGLLREKGVELPPLESPVVSPEEPVASPDAAQPPPQEAPPPPPPADDLDPADAEHPESELPALLQCKICLQEEACALFLPCSHLGCCANCADRLQAIGCPFCRSPVREWTLVYRA